MKKLLTAAIAICMVLGSMSAFAVSDKVVFDITSLGIVTGDEQGNLLLNEEITRAEFAKMMINLRGYAEISEMNSGSELFSDIPEEHWAKTTINFAASIGMFEGYPDGKFGPEDKVLLQDAIKTVVKALGYDVVAQQKGGYPNGYIMVATEQQLLKDITASYSAPAVRGDVMTLLYNALDVELLQEATSNGRVVYEEADDTFRSLLTDKNDMVMIKGVVTTNHETWLANEITGLRDDEVEIDGMIFAVGKTDAADYIGQEVQIYCYENEAENRWEIVNVAPTKKNNVVTIAADEYMNYSGSRMEYEREGRKEYISVAQDAVYLYNNRVVPVFDAGYINDNSTSIYAVDNNGDEIYDYIFVNTYVSVVVDKAYSNGNLYFKNEFSLNGRNFLTLDEEDDDQHFTIENAAGETMKYADIKANDVVSVFSSEDGKELKLIVSDKKVQGSIRELRSEEGVYIDDTYYEFANSAVESKLRIGDVRAVYLNHENKVVYATDEGMEDGTTLYGYIQEMGQADGFGNVQAKIIDSAVIRNEEEENENKDDKNVIPVLVCQNAGMKVIDLNGKVSYNGVSMSAEKFMADFGSGPVKYQLDSTGKLKTIDDPERRGGQSGIQIKYNAKDKVFGGYVAYGGFRIDNNTKVVCVPTNPDASDEDYMVQLRIDNKDANRQYYAQGYEYDENSKAVKFLVISDQMKADDILNIVPLTSKIGLVSGSTQVTDETGETVYRTELLYDGELITLMSNNIVQGKNDAITRLKRGDLIWFSKNNNGLMDNARIIKSLKTDDENMQENKDSDEETLFGYVKELSFNDVDVANNRTVHTVKLMIENEKTEDILIPARTLPSIYIYDSAAKTVKVGGLEDIRPYTGSAATSDKVFVVRPHRNVRVVVIVR
ncbi:MAG: S-layer homology domain-containing protein [Clostridia bacterium]|nr:S-layer homology domain-containing protein [Clostridia bacterium]